MADLGPSVSRLSSAIIGLKPGKEEGDAMRRKVRCECIQKLWVTNLHRLQKSMGRKVPRRDRFKDTENDVGFSITH